MRLMKFPYLSLNAILARLNNCRLENIVIELKNERFVCCGVAVLEVTEILGVV